MAQHALITCKSNHPHKQILIAGEIISTISPITSQNHQIIPLRRRIVSRLSPDRRLLLFGLRPRSERIPKKLSWNTQNHTSISHQFPQTHPQKTKLLKLPDWADWGSSIWLIDCFSSCSSSSSFFPCLKNNELEAGFYIQNSLVFLTIIIGRETVGIPHNTTQISSNAP